MRLICRPASRAPKAPRIVWITMRPTRTTSASSPLAAEITGAASHTVIHQIRIRKTPARSRAGDMGSLGSVSIAVDPPTRAEAFRADHRADELRRTRSQRRPGRGSARYRPWPARTVHRATRRFAGESERHRLHHRPTGGLRHAVREICCLLPNFTRSVTLHVPAWSGNGVVHG